MYVISGASGNTGAVVADALLARGEKVRVLGRNAAKLERFTKRGAESKIVDVADPNAALLADAFSGAKAIYVMIPPDPQTNDGLAYQGVVSKAFATALQRAAVEHAVVLSSFGAERPDRCGPVVGLHRLEQELRKVAGLNALFLRPGYFMENTLPQVGAIKGFGMMAGPLRGDLKLPLIATRDIGSYAAERLAKLDFEGVETRELLGNADLSYDDAARIIGEAISNPGLKYQRLPNDQMKGLFVQLGMSENMAELILEMCDALNEGYMKGEEPRGAANTTPTSYETFVQDTFVPLYEGRAAHA
jgi:uncharacterized protein YbjT (DUF2867 family)